MDDSTTADPLIVLSDAEFRAAYTIKHSLGAGGGGEVFLATQASLQRPVVIKAIQHSLLDDEVQLLRFQREARMLSRLSHVRITQAYEYGVWAGRPYLVMEYVDGGSLASLMEHGGALEPREAIRIALEIAEGLAYLHERKMLHRDIKPGNILLTADRSVKIADFGLARPHDEVGLTGEGLVVGTLWYIAPELLINEEASPRTDIYSLGMVTYQMLTMRMAFKEEITDLVKLAAHRVNDPIIPIQQRDPELPPELCSLVNRMIASDPAARPASAARVVEDLSNLYDALATPSRRLKRKPADPAEGTAQLSADEMLQAASARPGERTKREDWNARLANEGESGSADAAPGPVTPRPESTLRKSRRTRAQVSWFHLSGHARALMAGFAIAGIVSGLLIGLRMQPRVPAVDPGLQAVRTSELKIERFPRWVHARFTSMTPGKLVVRCTPSKGGPTLEAESSDLHEHDVSVEKLDMRTAYQVHVHLKLANGVEQAVGSQSAPSPLTELLDLARALEHLQVADALKDYDEARGFKKAPVADRIAAIPERVRFKARAAALGDLPAAVYADPDVLDSELVEIYRGFAPLRLLDHYADAHGLNYRTGVERVMPFDLRASDAPAPKVAPVATALFDDARLLIPYDPQAELLVDIGDQLSERSPLYHRAVPALEGSLVVPPGIDKKSPVQLKLSLTNVRSSLFSVTIEGIAVSLDFVPPYRHALAGDACVLYHAVPPRWLASAGRRKITVRAKAVRCTQNNFTRPITVYKDVEQNMPSVDDVTLLAP